MPSLDRSLVKHPLPMKPGLKPHKQPPWKMVSDVINYVKDEIKQLLEYIFIKPIRYTK
jgi:hypothetical protein